VLWPAGELQDPVTSGTDIARRPGFHVNFQLSAELQRERSLLNHTLRLTPVYRFDVDYPTEKARSVRKAWSMKDVRGLTRSTLSLARSPRGALKVAQKTWHRGRGGPLDHYSLTMYLEQAPNPESRLYLSDARDALGMPKLVVDWRLTPLDAASFERTLEELSAAFTRAGLGRLEFGDLTVDDTFDAAHHIGATRMGTTPEDGVVDANCRVFGTENLYIASSSVFPTGHSMGPTLTIVALARRLAAHLLQGDVQRHAGSPPLA
jgi:choline dehydrogenase-like flavoprotein